VKGGSGKDKMRSVSPPALCRGKEVWKLEDASHKRYLFLSARPAGRADKNKYTRRSALPCSCKTALHGGKPRGGVRRQVCHCLRRLVFSSNAGTALLANQHEASDSRQAVPCEVARRSAIRQAVAHRGFCEEGTLSVSTTLGRIRFSGLRAVFAVRTCCRCLSRRSGRRAGRRIGWLAVGAAGRRFASSRAP